MQRLLTGIQPTGPMHIGNYLAVIKPFVETQGNYESFFMIVDLHGLTISQDPATYQNQVLDLAATLLACGLDPQKTTFFLQSAIPAHTELTWIFNTITPVGELDRMTQFKEKSDKHGANM